MSKAKILLAPCQQNLLKCEVKIAQIPKKQKQKSKSRTFAESKFVAIECGNKFVAIECGNKFVAIECSNKFVAIECGNTRRALLKHESMEGWSLRAEAPALSDFYSFQKQKTHF